MDILVPIRDKLAMLERTIPSTLRTWSLPHFSLDAAGLVALADLTTVAQRTVLTGTASYLDALVLCPGLHRQQQATGLNAGEYPACAAMTTGYVFRVENPAMVLFLQKVGRPGALTTLSVSGVSGGGGVKRSFPSRFAQTIFDYEASTPLSALAYLSTISLTITVLTLIVLLEDRWALAVIGLLILARILNTLVIRRRAVPGWFGAAEPGVRGELLILLSQDRWIRLAGAVDDLKAVTSGQWLRDATFVEGCVVAAATLLVYLDAALAGNADQMGNLLLLVLLGGSAALLGIANECTEVLRMHGRLVERRGARRKYARRLLLADELAREFRRTDCFVGMGMMQPQQAKKLEKELGLQNSDARAVTM